MKKIKKLLALSLALVLSIQTNYIVFANNIISRGNSNNVTSPSNQYVFINGNYYSKKDVIDLLNNTTPGECVIKTNKKSRSAVAITAIYVVPGLGEVALLVTGGIMIGTTIYYAGSWVHNTFSNWIKNSAKQEAQDAANSVSNKVKEKGSNDKIDLDQFKDKNGKTPKNKNSGTFRSTKDNRYTIEKDTSGHTGYDGTTKSWKLYLSGKRIASLNSYGKIVGK